MVARHATTTNEAPGAWPGAEAVGIAVLAAAAAGRVGIASLTHQPTPERTTASQLATASRGAMVDVTIVDAVLHPAASERGRRRRHPRQSVELGVSNRASATTTLARPTIEASGASVGADLHAIDEAHGLLEPLPAGSSIRCVLRFKTAGDLTDLLFENRRATMHIAGHTFDLRVKIGDPAA